MLSPQIWSQVYTLVKAKPLWQILLTIILIADKIVN